MFKQDIRYAIRSLLKNPGFTAIAVACLALGIGVNSTIFSVVDGVILSPTPYPEADRIVVVNSTNPKENVRRGGLSYADYKDFRDSNTTIASLAAFTDRSLTIADSNGDPERYRGATISWNLFPLLGVAPVAGRNFTPEDDRPGAEPVVLLSHEVWERRYQKDPARHRPRDQRQWPSAQRRRRDAAALPVPGEPAAVGADRVLPGRHVRAISAACRFSRG